MSNFSERFVQTAQRVLPSPFSIAVLLTFFTMLLALVLTEPLEGNEQAHWLQILGHWEGGFFLFLKFAMQMMLILVLGHVLALTPPAEWLMQRLLRYCKSTASAAYVVTLLTMLVALFNWGLGLIFGAIFARKVGEQAQRKGWALNYPLVAAAGYSGLMVWHGGISGSAPLEVAKPDHDLVEQIGQIPFGETIFSPMNLLCMLLLLGLIPLAMYWLGKRVSPTELKLDLQKEQAAPKRKIKGAERLDQSPYLVYILGALMLFILFSRAIFMPLLAGEGFDWSFGFITPNFIIFLLFALALMLQGNVGRFTSSVNEGIVGSSGILVQFPLYAGIMGIMLGSGLVQVMAGFFESISTEQSFPVFTFFSAGLVNIFVPSGGGQWGVQGPIIVEAAKELNVPIGKGILAMAYGDQITNMLQPFWALPLLGITGLEAKDILPYTLYLLLLGSLIFITVLLVF